MKKLTDEDYISGGIQKDFFEEEEREFCHCPLCDNNTYEQLDIEKGLSIVKCKNCDLIYTNPRAKSAQVNYFGDADAFYDEARLIFKGKKPHHRDKNYEEEVVEIKKFKKGGKLLDIGANMGFFLKKARDLGFEVEGVEPSAALSKIANQEWGIKMHASFLEDANLDEENYDVITLIDVLEHVTNPSQMLDICHKLLKPNGIMAIKVPNGDYNILKTKLAKALKKREGMEIWDSGEHVVFYTPKTFAKMAEKHGFKVNKTFVPLPVHPPLWPDLVGHFYQYPTPFILDWKRIIMRKLFYRIGKVELFLRRKTQFGPDLMFIIEKIGS